MCENSFEKESRIEGVVKGNQRGLGGEWMNNFQNRSGN
jgi:hypothetical protein